MPSTKSPRVYVDTLVFLNVLFKESGLWPDSLKVLKAIDRGDVTLVASTMLHAELCGWSGKVDDNAAHQRELQAYLDSPDVVLIEVDTLLIRQARALAAKHHLHGPDAVHLAAALRLEADSMFTRDARLLRVGRSEAGLSVSQPEVIWRPTLEDASIDEQAVAEKQASLQSANQDKDASRTPVTEAPVLKMVPRPRPRRHSEP